MACSQVRDAALALVRAQPVENILAQAQPGAVRVMAIDQLTPNRGGKSISRLPSPKGSAATCNPWMSDS